jgi:hypothetical protein
MPRRRIEQAEQDAVAAVIKRARERRTKVGFAQPLTVTAAPSAKGKPAAGEGEAAVAGTRSARAMTE